MSPWRQVPLTSPVARVLRDGLAESDEPVRIRAVRARPLGSFSSHPIDRLHVTLDDGRELALIFKRLTPQPGRIVGREVLIYRRLLSGRRLGAPELYASHADDVRGRAWLFLEDLGRSTLDDRGPEEWTVGFRWLAGLHAAHVGREHELRAPDCLAEHDEAFYRSLVASARATLVARGTAPAARRFDRLAAGFEEMVAYLTSRPRTLVHGATTGQNLVVTPGGIRPVDWESAAIGTAAWDVAKLLEGWGSHRARLLDGYVAAFEALAPLDRRAFRLDLAHGRVLRALRLLYWWKEPCQRDPSVQSVLDGIEEAWAIGAGTTHGD